MEEGIRDLRFQWFIFQKEPNGRMASYPVGRPGGPNSDHLRGECVDLRRGQIVATGLCGVIVHKGGRRGLAVAGLVLNLLVPAAVVGLILFNG